MCIISLIPGKWSSSKTLKLPASKTGYEAASRARREAAKRDAATVPWRFGVAFIWASETAMPGRHVDTEKLESVAVECLDAELIAAKMVEVDWSRKRKTAPLNVILPATLIWAGDLPKQVRPIALMRRFPRIANLLAANWNDPTAFHKYIGSLLIDRRGGRQGFPSEVKEELVRLRTAYSLRTSDASRL